MPSILLLLRLITRHCSLRYVSRHIIALLRHAGDMPCFHQHCFNIDISTILPRHGAIVYADIFFAMPATAAYYYDARRDYYAKPRCSRILSSPRYYAAIVTQHIVWFAACRH